MRKVIWRIDIAAIKSDLIYRFLIEQDNLLKFQKQIRLFEWTGSEELAPINIGEHLSPCMVHKTNYDINELSKVLLENPLITTKELRENIGYTNAKLHLLQGYKDQLTGYGRNTLISN